MPGHVHMKPLPELPVPPAQATFTTEVVQYFIGKTLQGISVAGFAYSALTESNAKILLARSLLLGIGFACGYYVSESAINNGVAKIALLHEAEKQYDRKVQEYNQAICAMRGCLMETNHVAPQ